MGVVGWNEKTAACIIEPSQAAGGKEPMCRLYFAWKVKAARSARPWSINERSCYGNATTHDIVAQRGLKPDLARGPIERANDRETRRCPRWFLFCSAPWRRSASSVGCSGTRARRDRTAAVVGVERRTAR